MDELDALGNVVRRGFVLGMRDVLPAGHSWVQHVEPTPTHAELVAAVLAKARVLRVPILSILDGMQASAVANGSAALALQIETSKQALKDITTTDLSACTTRAEMENTILAAYQAICLAAPAQVRSAFNSLVP